MDKVTSLSAGFDSNHFSFHVLKIIMEECMSRVSSVDIVTTTDCTSKGSWFDSRWFKIISPAFIKTGYETQLNR
jgi:hypothetical protein